MNLPDVLTRLVIAKNAKERKDAERLCWIALGEWRVNMRMFGTSLKIAAPTAPIEARAECEAGAAWALSQAAGGGGWKDE